MAFRRRKPLSPEPPRPLCLLSSLREASGPSNGLSFMPCSNIPSMPNLLPSLSPALLSSNLSIYVYHCVLFPQGGIRSAVFMVPTPGGVLGTLQVLGSYLSNKYS